MTIQNVSYAINPRFSFPRSYCRGILIGYGAGAIVNLASNVIHVHQDLGSGNYIDTFVTLLPAFVPWSSNVYTLDYVFQDQVSYVNSGPPFYFHATIDYGLMTPSAKFGCGITFDGATETYNIFLAPAPAGYWLPELP